MIKKIVLLSVLVLLCITAGAQSQDSAAKKKAEKARIANVKKQLDAAKTSLKKQQNVANVETSMRTLLKDSLNGSDIRIRLILRESLLQQYAQLNEKAFLKQAYDTAAMFQITKRLFIATNELDSIDAIPNAKGVSAPKYREENAEQLKHFVNNIYSGVVYYVNKQKWNEAIELADLYLNLPSWNFGIKEDEKRAIHTSYLSLFSGYKANNYPAALRHVDEALKYEQRYEISLQYLSSMAISRLDTVRYEKFLTMGLDANPTSTFFFPRLIDYYVENSNLEKAAEITDKVLNADKDNIQALVAKQTIMLNLEQYDDCISLGDRILSIIDEQKENVDSTALAEANYNTGLAYYNQSLEVQKTVTNPRLLNNTLKPLYQKCRPYMERYRQLAPDQKERWKPVLYNIYLNLNMGKEFAEIDSL